MHTPTGRWLQCVYVTQRCVFTVTTEWRLVYESAIRSVNDSEKLIYEVAVTNSS